MKTFYYFCESCGGDTAVYEERSSCPYCHARGPQFHKVADVEEKDRHTEVLQKISEFRVHWVSNHQGQAVGQAPRRRGMWPRRRTR